MQIERFLSECLFLWYLDPSKDVKAANNMRLNKHLRVRFRDVVSPEERTEAGAEAENKNRMKVNMNGVDLTDGAWRGDALCLKGEKSRLVYLTRRREGWMCA
ncbi:hypothetical protein ATANTOWER_027672 [Ataeniobius toweri]|uniref:Uncharacterized protein n=1 Tax=Ataeniobius toweri TaxID=208326 RepID=A0ABU7BJV7_9TELE|nr:hypothetical protein [Ataeniobius toweri]